jgi:hypothetical protein
VGRRGRPTFVDVFYIVLLDAGRIFQQNGAQFFVAGVQKILPPNPSATNFESGAVIDVCMTKNKKIYLGGIESKVTVQNIRFLAKALEHATVQ